MSSFRARALALFVVAALPASFVLRAGDARASVSIAVAFEPLVKDSSAVAIVTPTEQTCVWENGRIYTYTRVHADTAVAGEVALGAEVWVRTMGGVVGHIGQSVDGEPVLTVGRPSLLFLRAGPAGAFEVTARAQGQFPVTLDESTKASKLMKSSAVGVLLPPKQALQAEKTLSPKALQSAPAPAAPLFAAEALHGRRVEDAVKDIAAAWKRLHAK